MPISVIIPTYNNPDALDVCLMSAINGQVHKNQIIVVVDGTYEINKYILDAYKDDIEILDLKMNYGLCGATNLGVYNARHEKILIVNDDNVFPYMWDNVLNKYILDDLVISPNQIEPKPSIFRQFIIKDLGTDLNQIDII